ncbi:hypothetical protein B5G22_07140 [Limosilactobacillus reuteri]|uniref:Oligosaccharide repeat unit polymerase n=1 Tax=Limosilactobacillus reuteri TaxID=1598 RepID=A0A1Y3UDH8_LIMRT|nr:O-antigen polymerase [Limosilactobacillus reuteri]OUN46866.1 hypothetical protein B5G22_07140 [Limosilactobacillus reuteri]OUP88452.1 hypothetical protein B5F04_07325 [Limosilactobacillus reuteri]
MVILLFILFLILTVITYIVFKKDIMAPPFIFCAMYTFSIGLALTEYSNWELSSYSFSAFSIYFGGAIIFVMMAVLSNQSINALYGTSDYIFKENEIKNQYVNKFFLLLIIVVDLVALVLLIKDVKSLTGGGSLSHMMEVYRSLTSYSSKAQLPGYDQQLTKFVTASAYICGFLLINNFMSKNYNKYILLLALPEIIYCIYSIYLSNRLNLLQLIAALVVYYCFLKSVKNGNIIGSVKLLFKVLIVFITMLLLFYLIRLMVGRTSSSGTGVIDYLAMYVGGPVKLFDLYMQNPLKSDFWGKETFYGLIRNLRSFGLVNFPDYISHKEFRSINGIGLGNIYTAYRPWIADFGIGGMLILQSIFGLFFNSLYFLIKKINYYHHIFLLILYGYVITPVFMHPIDDHFYSMFFNLGFVSYLIIFYLIYWILTRKFKI